TNVYPDHYVGRLGAFAVLAGLVSRRRTGRGVHFDAAQFEAAIQLLGDVFALESLEAGAARPIGNASTRGVPWGAYPCAGEDEWCVINVRSDGEWRALRAVLGDPEWASAPDLEDLSGRRAASEVIDRGLAEWTALRPPREAMEILQAAGVPSGIVAHAGHHHDDPHLAARGYPTRLVQQDLGPVVLEGTPFSGSDLPDPIATQAPRLGEHTRVICRAELGLEEDEIEELLAAGVLEDPP
ncbi:MAG: CoA transferase, partial [Myxococcota bacterium]